jgi:hypothetical protein
MSYKLYGILYLIIIIFYLLRPLLPYIEYVVNKEYIEKNLCVERADPENNCHGKCHLHEQLEKQGKPLDADTNDNNKIVPDKKLDDHIICSITFPGLFANKIILYGSYSDSLTELFIFDIFIPPRHRIPVLLTSL